MAINAIEKRKTLEKINETKSWFIEKIDKMDKLLARLTKKMERTLKKSRKTLHRDENNHKKVIITHRTL